MLTLKKVVRLGGFNNRDVVGAEHHHQRFCYDKFKGDNMNKLQKGLINRHNKSHGHSPIKWCINPNCEYSVGQENDPMSVCTKCGTVQEPKEIENNCTTCLISNILFEKIKGLIANSCCSHASDCAVHNEPAYPAGECDCK
jgi:hypothetical protein